MLRFFRVKKIPKNVLRFLRELPNIWYQLLRAWNIPKIWYKLSKTFSQHLQKWDGKIELFLSFIHPGPPEPPGQLPPLPFTDGGRGQLCPRLKKNQFFYVSIYNTLQALCGVKLWNKWMATFWWINAKFKAVMKYYQTNIDLIKTDSLLNFSVLAFLLV